VPAFEKVNVLVRSGDRHDLDKLIRGRTKPEQASESAVRISTVAKHFGPCHGRSVNHAPFAEQPYRRILV
jgi:hypothetical protein